MKVESVPVSSLVLDPANARKHAPKNLEAIKGSLAKFGQQKPIVVTPKGVVLAGNGTLEAARALGWDKIDCVRTKLDGTDATAYAIADNRTGELAEWDAGALSETLKSLQELDFDLGSIGFDADDLAAMIATPEPPEGLTDPDEMPDDVEPRTKPGDLWVLGEHRLLCGDSTNVQHVERLLAGEKPLLMVTDPPYGVEYDPNWRNEAAAAGYLSGGARSDDRVDWTAVWALWEPQVIYCWHDALRGAEVAKSLADCGLELVSQLIWVKPRFAISRQHYNWRHEPCWFAVRKGMTQAWVGPENLSTVIEADNLSDERTGHGTQKPIKVMEYPIPNHTRRGDIVAEPFCGSGSTLIACQKTGRRCFGMEIDPHYCDVIVARWEAFTGKTAQLQSLEDAHGS